MTKEASSKVVSKQETSSKEMSKAETPMTLKDRIDKMIETEFNSRIETFCSPKCPIGTIFEVALKRHTSPQCKIRSVIEGIYCWYIISRDELYLELTNCLIEYINTVFNNKMEIEFFRSLVTQALESSETDFPYILVEVKNRIKSLTSELNDLVTKTLKKCIADEFLQNVSNNFETTEIKEATKILKNCVSNFAGSRNKDIYGIMFILDYNNRVNDADNPEFLKLSTLQFAQSNLKFLRANRIQVLSSKDYITKPKNNGYSAFHTVLQGSSTPLELQFRSRRMHENNENPDSSASHRVYKNTKFNNYLCEVVDSIYGPIKAKPTSFAEKMQVDAQNRLRYAISHETPLFSMDYFSRTPNGEIPASIEELNQFEGTNKLLELYESHFSKNAAVV